MVMVPWMETKADTPLGALQNHELEEEYPGRIFMAAKVSATGTR